MHDSNFNGVFVVLCLLFMMACIRADENVPPRGRDISDTGIYDLSEINNSQGGSTHLFCDPIPVENTAGCWENDISAFIDCSYDSLFNRFGNGWTGADATYSTTLPDGRRIWLFGDTFLGIVNPDGSRPGGQPFINNSLVIQAGPSLTTLHGGTESEPEAFVVPPNPDEWYWPNDPTVHDNELHVLLSRMGRSGSGGMWDFQLVAIDLAVYTLPDLTLKSLETKVDSNFCYYGACVMEDEDYTYIYGIMDEQLQKYVNVARAPGGDLTADWEFYNGADWQNTPSDYVIKDAVSNQFSVFSSSGKYYLMTQQIAFGDELLLFESASPLGSWTNQRTLYCTPEAGQGNLFTYNAFVHPELSRDGDLFITYNVNSFNFWDVFQDVRNYRPRFIRIENWK